MHTMMYLKQKKEWIFPIATGLTISLIIICIQYWTSSKPSTLPINTMSYAQVIEPVLPFNVSIYTNREADTIPQSLESDPYFSQYFSGKTRKQTNLGSGIVFNKDGIIVTNAHVVNSADEIYVVTSNNLQVRVTQTLIDPESDIAVLKTDLTFSSEPPTNLITPVQVGDIVFTIGNPFGIGQSVSLGIISATGRQQPGLTSLTDFIQTDASINPGNSGGALINSKGEIIGMNTAVFSSSGRAQGIGFAIPYAHVDMVAQDLINNGLVSRGYLGVDVTEHLVTNGNIKSYLKIVSVDHNSPAKIAGLEVGDNLVAINDMPLLNRSSAVRLISQLMPGKKTKIDILREDQPLKLVAILNERK